MTRRTLALIALALMLLLAACAGGGAPGSSASEDAHSATEDADGATTPTTAPTAESASSDADGATTPTTAPTAESASSDADGATTTGESASEDADSATTDATTTDAATTDAATAAAPTADAAMPPATPTPPLLATRTGADYVLRLPREDAVPANWAMSPLPDFQSRAPRPGDTYRFACRDLPARSIGIATVGYRHLDGLPSVAIEYVIYGSAADAADALVDMRAAAETCGDFTLGAGGATTAAFAPLDFPELGDDRFAVALSTSSDASGDLLTHVVKVRQSHVVIGISHTTYADEAPPDDALTRALVERAVDNLRDAPQPVGPSAN